MRLHETVEEILGNKIKICILRLLYKTRGIFSGREISRLVGFSPTQTISNLRDLEAAGLVMRQRAGKTDLYQLNTVNSATDGLLSPVFDWESNLVDELAAMYVEKLGNKLISIKQFGSAARGEEGPGSDIDLLLTLEDSVDPEKIEGAVYEVDLAAGQRFGCPVSSIFVTASEYKRKVRSKKGFWKDIPTESKTVFKRNRQD